MAAHAKLSASKMKQAKACPASVSAQLGHPNRESKAAREGTAAHWVAEQVLLSRVDPYPGDALVPVDFVSGNAPNGVEITWAMVRAVEVYVEEVVARARGADVVRIEAKLSSLEALDPDLGGTSDVIILNKSTRTLYVGDYKNGAGVLVDPEENEQAMTYGLGALLLPEFSVSGIDTVEIFIVQPNASGPPVKVWRTDPLRLLEWAAELVEIAAATRDPNAKRVAGEHCQFCLDKGECNAHYNFALDAAGLTAIDFYSEVIPKVETPDRLSPADLAKRLHQAEHLKRWIKSVEEHAAQMAADGRPPDGFKLVAGRGSRVFRDQKLAFETVAGALGYQVSDFYESEPKSVAQLENFVGKKDLKNVDWKSLIETKPGRPTLAPASDPRPEIKKGNVFDVFAGFDED